MIRPLFQEKPLLTSKQYDLELFFLALSIHMDPLLSMKEKDALLLKLRQNSDIPTGYTSPAWEGVTEEDLKKDPSLLDAIMPKSWLVGFVEAEGSFYIVKKDKNGRYVHGFEVTQKLDRVVLAGISIILGTSAPKKKKNANTTVTTSAKPLSFIDGYFAGTMKGMKAVEFRIWSRALKSTLPPLEKYAHLAKIQAQMRKIRSIRLNPDFSRRTDARIRSFD